MKRTLESWFWILALTAVVSIAVTYLFLRYVVPIAAPKPDPNPVETIIGLSVSESYARTNSPSAKAGAVYLTIRNYTGADEVLLSATSEVAAMVELHTSETDANGVVKMTPLADGLDIPAGETILMEPGGAHIMLMGLSGPLEDGQNIPVDFNFERAGTVTIQVPVKNGR